MPITSATILTGASLVTNDRPMGDRQSSPKVWNE